MNSESYPQMSEVIKEKPSLSSSFFIEEPTASEKSQSEAHLQRENDKMEDAENETNRMQTCFVCQESLRDRSSKLLACLHSVCTNCLPSLHEPFGNAYKCLVCDYKSRADMVCDNLYLTNDEENDNGKSQIEQSDNGVPRTTFTCSSCEEGNIGDWYCNNCRDWLCGECKNAHSRVRLTKDHIVVQKGFDQLQPPRQDKPMNCPIHKHEMIRIYCEDCEVLTCRDCQLERHKDHRYTFIDAAVHSQRKNLRSLMNKVRECRTMLDRCQIATAQRSQAIDTIEMQTISDIKVFGMHIISEVSNICKELINDMNGVCEKARIQFSEKQSRLDQFIQNIDHSLEFVEEAVNTGSDVALLSSKRLITYRLDDILNDSYEWSKSSPHFQLSFQFEPNRFRQVISKLGVLFVNGKPVAKTHQQKLNMAITNNQEKLDQTNDKEQEITINDSIWDDHNQTSDLDKINNTHITSKRNDKHNMLSEMPKVRTTYQNTVNNHTTYNYGHQNQEQSTNWQQQNQKSSFIEQENTLATEKQQQQQILDTSDDFCAVCRTGGDLLCCDMCPRVYHIECHVPPLDALPKGEFKCSICTDIVPDEQQQTNESFENGDDTRQITLKRKRDDSNGLTSHERQICEKILLQLYIHDESPPFQEPVPATIPEYYRIIVKPMDLRTIREKLLSTYNSYSSIFEFIADIRLIFQNCAIFNVSDSPVAKAGVVLSKYFEDLSEQYLNTSLTLNPSTPTSDTSSDRQPHTHQSNQVHQAKHKRKKAPEEIVHYIN